VRDEMLRAGRLCLRPAHPDDAVELAPHLMRLDVLEVEALGRDPLEALTLPFFYGHGAETVTCWRDDGIIIGMGGVFPFRVGQGAVWYLGRDEIRETPRDAIILAKRYLAQLRKTYSWLGNIIIDGDPERARLIRNMGFDIGADVTQYSDIAFRSFGWKADGPERDGGPV